MIRSLTKAEADVIRLVAGKLPLDIGRQLLLDLSLAKAESVIPDGSRVQFTLADYQRPPYRGQRSFGVSGKLLDNDGASLSFDLFADENGRLFELELIRWDEGELISPDWPTLKLYG
jgi:hypothetical protein